MTKLEPGLTMRQDTPAMQDRAAPTPAVQTPGQTFSHAFESLTQRIWYLKGQKKVMEELKGSFATSEETSRYQASIEKISQAIQVLEQQSTQLELIKKMGKPQLDTARQDTQPESKTIPSLGLTLDDAQKPPEQQAASQPRSSTHEAESSTNAQKTAGKLPFYTGPTNNPALDDVHKQWHLLNVQNERRLLHARQEKEQTARQNAQQKAIIDSFTKPFIDYISENATVYHAVDAVAKLLEGKGFRRLFERGSTCSLERGGKYFHTRNGSSIIAFTIGKDYEAGNGASIIASHIDALSARVKPISKVPNKAGYVQLGIAPYAGALNGTWWDRDLGIGGRVIVRNRRTGKISTQLVKLDWPVARIPTLAPHFGQAASFDRANKETEMVPIIGVDNGDLYRSSECTERESVSKSDAGILGDFESQQPQALLGAIVGALDLGPETPRSAVEIINWDLELFDTQPACLGGIDKSLLFAGRLDDKLCSWTAMTALMLADDSSSPHSLKIVGCFDDEEIGSLLRQGAHSNFLMSTIARINECFTPSPSTLTCPSNGSNKDNLLYATLAKSFLVSADVCHAANPNYLQTYLPYHSPRLNIGVAISADPNGHTTTDAISTAWLQRVAGRCKPKHKLQIFQIRNDTRSGGTVGPMLSSALGCRAIDAGIVQLSMHSIRATTGSRDVGLGVQLFKAVLDEFEAVNAEFDVMD